MSASPNPKPSLEDQLAALRAIESVKPAQRILSGIAERVRWQQREFIAAVFGACVAGIGLLVFTLRGEAFATVSLALGTALLILCAGRSGRNAARLATLESGESLLSAWRQELARQLRHTLIAPLLAVLFLGLTVGQVVRDGPLSLKSLAFLLVAGVVCTFAAHQRFVLRPLLLRELRGLEEDG